MIGTGWVSMVAALAVTLGLCALALALLKKMAPGALLPRHGLPMRVVQRLSLGPRQGVTLLQVGERVLLVALADTGGATLLGELEGEDRARALAAGGPEPRPGAGRFDLPTFLTAVGRGLRGGGALLALGLLLLVPRPALAQHITSPPPVKGLVSKAPPSVMTHTGVGPQPPVVMPPALPQVDIKVGEGKDQVHLSGAVGLVVFLGVLTLLPALFMLMTSFTRILIVLHFLRSALGTQTAPPSQLLVALAVLLTGVVMHPVLEQTNKEALQPYFAGQIQQGEAYTRALLPFRAFMMRNVREQDLTAFAEMSGITDIQNEDDLPILTVVTAFVVSELRTAFQMGFIIYLPFVVVDVIVASVLMSLGMFMLPPVMISMPLKLLLFVLADGWTLVVQNLVSSFK